MFETLIYIAIYVAILKRIETPVIEGIRKSDDIHKIIRLRKKLVRIRKTSLVIYFAFLVAIILTLTLCEGEGLKDPAFPQLLLISTLSSYLWLRRRSDHNPLGRLSHTRKEEILQAQEPYVLFLRSFEKDDYTPEMLIRKDMKRFPVFSEYHFTRHLTLYRKVYAVGMTQEIEAPPGAERVYLSDNNWKEDVRELMEHAACIFILVDARKSCIWEIKQSSDMFRKTIYIIDDLETFKEASAKLQSSISFPQSLEEHPTPIAMYSRDGNFFCLGSFQHNNSSYKRLIEAVTESFPGLNVPIPLWKRLAQSSLVHHLIVWSLIIATSFACAYSMLDTNDPAETGHSPLFHFTASFVAFTILFSLTYYVFFIHTTSRLKIIVPKFFLWLALFILAAVCANECTKHFPDHLDLSMAVFLTLFMLLFSLLYLFCLLPLLRWFRKVLPWRKTV